jgi:U3 small nucleolar ribonucleoprotein protein IMP4
LWTIQILDIFPSILELNPLDATKIMKSSSLTTTTASHRRQTRLRREYLYRKSLEGTERQLYEKKRLLRNALAQGKSLPTEIRASYDSLQREISQEDAKTAMTHSITTTSSGISNVMDDEYASTAGIYEPRVCVTTSRDPSSRLKQFAKELKLLVPNSIRINRGNSRTEDLLQMCREQSECSDLIIVQETRGEPDGLVICHLPLGPTAFFTISHAVLRHDLPRHSPMSEAYPHLIFEGFQSELGTRLSTILKCLFPIPKPDSRRVVSFINQNDSISFRHHMYTKPNHETVELHEVGPRFELKLYQIRLGTLEQKEAQNEYVLRPYQNTAHKRNVL